MKKSSFHVVSTAPINIGIQRPSPVVLAIIDTALRSTKTPLITPNVFRMENLTLSNALVDKISQIARTLANRGLIVLTKSFEDIKNLDDLVNQLPKGVTKQQIEQIIPQSPFESLFLFGQTPRIRMSLEEIAKKYRPIIGIITRYAKGQKPVGAVPDVVHHELSHPIIEGLKRTAPVRSAFKDLVTSIKSSKPTQSETSDPILHSIAKQPTLPLEETLTQLMATDMATISLENLLEKSKILKGTKLETYLRTMNEAAKSFNQVYLGEQMETLNQLLQARGLPPFTMKLEPLDIAHIVDTAQRMMELEQWLNQPLSYLNVLNKVVPEKTHKLFRYIFSGQRTAEDVLKTLKGKIKNEEIYNAIDKFLSEVLKPD